jgi:hypothetical protein
LLQVQRQAIADTTICCAWRRLVCIVYAGRLSYAFPGTELEPIPNRCRMIARVPARPRVEPIDGDFKLMHYPT